MKNIQPKTDFLDPPPLSNFVNFEDDPVCPNRKIFSVYAQHDFGQRGISSPVISSKDTPPPILLDVLE